MEVYAWIAAQDKKTVRVGWGGVEGVGWKGWREVIISPCSILVVLDVLNTWYSKG